MCVSLSHWHGFSTPEQAQGLSHRKVSVVLLSLHRHPSCAFCVCACMHYCMYVCTRVYTLMTSPSPEGLHMFAWVPLHMLHMLVGLFHHTHKSVEIFTCEKKSNISVSFVLLTSCAPSIRSCFGFWCCFGAPLKVWTCFILTVSVFAVGFCGVNGELLFVSFLQMYEAPRFYRAVKMFCSFHGLVSVVVVHFIHFRSLNKCW